MFEFNMKRSLVRVDIMTVISMIPLSPLLRCLAHFPPADTYESRGNAADVSCVMLAEKFLSRLNERWNECAYQ